jgi:hypothetical protein
MPYRESAKEFEIKDGEEEKIYKWILETDNDEWAREKK